MLGYIFPGFNGFQGTPKYLKFLNKPMCLRANALKFLKLHEKYMERKSGFSGTYNNCMFLLI